MMSYRLRRVRAPFLPVAYVEHHLVPLTTDEEIPGWWELKWRSPSAALVFHTVADSDEDFREGARAQALTELGWSVLPAGLG